MNLGNFAIGLLCLWSTVISATEGIFTAIIGETYSDYTLNYEKCRTALWFEFHSPRPFVGIDSNCSVAMSSIMGDVDSLMREYKLIDVLRTAAQIRLFVDDLSSDDFLRWAEFIRYTNQAQGWPKSVNSNTVVISDFVHDILPDAPMIKVFQAHLKSMGCQSKLAKKRDYTENILLMPQQDVISKGILTKQQAQKEYYPFGFFIVFDLACSQPQ